MFGMAHTRSYSASLPSVVRTVQRVQLHKRDKRTTTALVQVVYLHVTHMLENADSSVQCCAQFTQLCSVTGTLCCRLLREQWALQREHTVRGQMTCLLDDM
jgi:hypothetical protein